MCSFKVYAHYRLDPCTNPSIHLRSMHNNILSYIKVYFSGKSLWMDIRYLLRITYIINHTISIMFSTSKLIDSFYKDTPFAINIIVSLHIHKSNFWYWLRSFTIFIHRIVIIHMHILLYPWDKRHEISSCMMF